MALPLKLSKFNAKQFETMHMLSVVKVYTRRLTREVGITEAQYCNRVVISQRQPKNNETMQPQIFDTE